ncbi:hypothetical protein SH501x_000896 [Pirellulaceae bacterium SH501]
MGELFAVLFFSRAVTDIRRLYEERFLVQRCLDVAKECLKYDSPLLTILQFSNNVAGELPRMSDEAIEYHVKKCSEALDVVTIERVSKTAAELSAPVPAAVDENADVDADGEAEAGTEDDQKASEPAIVDAVKAEAEPEKAEVAKAEAPKVEPVKTEAEPQKPETESQKTEEAPQESGKDVSGVAVADLELGAELKKHLIVAGINTVADIQRLHAEKGLTSLENIGERKAELILAAIKKLG